MWLIALAIMSTAVFIGAAVAELRSLHQGRKLARRSREQRPSRLLPAPAGESGTKKHG